MLYPHQCNRFYENHSFLINQTGSLFHIPAYILNFNEMFIDGQNYLNYCGQETQGSVKGLENLEKRNQSDDELSTMVQHNFSFV